MRSLTIGREDEIVDRRNDLADRLNASRVLPFAETSGTRYDVRKATQVNCQKVNVRVTTDSRQRKHGWKGDDIVTMLPDDNKFLYHEYVAVKRNLF